MNESNDVQEIVRNYQFKIQKIKDAFESRIKQISNLLSESLSKLQSDSSISSPTDLKNRICEIVSASLSHESSKTISELILSRSEIINEKMVLERENYSLKERLKTQKDELDILESEILLYRNNDSSLASYESRISNLTSLLNAAQKELSEYKNRSSSSSLNDELMRSQSDLSHCLLSKESLQNKYENDKIQHEYSINNYKEQISKLQSEIRDKENHWKDEKCQLEIRIREMDSEKKFNMSAIEKSRIDGTDTILRAEHDSKMSTLQLHLETTFQQEKQQYISQIRSEFELNSGLLKQRLQEENKISLISLRSQISVLEQNIDNDHHNIKQLENNLHKERANSLELLDQMNQLQNVIEEREYQLRTSITQLDEASRQNGRLKSMVSDEEARRIEIEKQCAHLFEELENCQRECKDLYDKFQSRDAAANNLAATLEKLYSMQSSNTPYPSMINSNSPNALRFEVDRSTALQNELFLLEKNRDALTKQLETIQSQFDNLKTKNSELENVNSQMRLEMKASKDNESKEYVNRITNEKILIENEKSELEKDKERMKEIIRSYGDKIINLETQLSILQENHSKLISDLTDSKTRVAFLEEENELGFSLRKKSDRDKEISNLKSHTSPFHNDELSSETFSPPVLNSPSGNEYKDSGAEIIENMRFQVIEQQKQLDLVKKQLESELTSRTSNIEVHLKQIDATDETMSSLKSILFSLSSENETLRLQQSHLHLAISKLKEEILTKKRYYLDLKSQKSKLESESAEMHSAIEEFKKEKGRLSLEIESNKISSLENINSELAKKIHSLTELKQNLVESENIESGPLSIEESLFRIEKRKEELDKIHSFLIQKESEAASALFTHIDQYINFDRENLLNDMSKLIENNEELQKTISIMQENNNDLQNEFNSKYRNEKESLHLALEKCNKMKYELEEKTRLYDELLSEKDFINSKIIAYESRLQEFQNSEKTAQKEAVAQNHTIRQYRDENMELKTKIEEMESERNKETLLFRSELETSYKREKELKDQLEEIFKAREDISKQVSELSKNLASTSKKLKNEIHHSSEVSSTLEKLEAEKEAIESNYSTAQEELADYDSALKLLHEDMYELQDKYDSLASTAKKQASMYDTELKSASDSIKNLASNYLFLSNNLDLLLKSVKKLKDDKLSLQMNFSKRFKDFQEFVIESFKRLKNTSSNTFDKEETKSRLLLRDLQVSMEKKYQEMESLYNSKLKESSESFDVLKNEMNQLLLNQNRMEQKENLLQKHLNNIEKQKAELLQQRDNYLSESLLRGDQLDNIILTLSSEIPLKSLQTDLFNVDKEKFNEALLNLKHTIHEMIASKHNFRKKSEIKPLFSTPIKSPMNYSNNNSEEAQLHALFSTIKMR